MKKILTKKNLIILAAVVLLVGGGAFAYNRYQTNRDADSGSDINNVDYGPPTAEEQAAGDEQKAENTEKESNISSTPSKSANLILIDANQYFDVFEVRAYISNQYEDGGTCTAIFMKDGQTVRQTSTAFKDASTTQCGALDLARSRFPVAGDWQLTVEYSSPTSSGKTTTQTVTIK